jgi:hypothetical protein
MSALAASSRHAAVDAEAPHVDRQILFGAPMEAISIMWAHVLSPNHRTKETAWYKLGSYRHQVS